MVVSCSGCGKPKKSRARDLLLNDRLLCRSCAVKLRMIGVTPWAATNAAAKKKRGVQKRLSIPDDQFKRLRSWALCAARRCNNPKNNQYHNYGGREIKFNFASYSEAIEYIWTCLGPIPDGMSIDRINNNGNYEIGNLRYATWSEQQYNKRPYKGGVYAHRMRELCLARPDYTYEGLRKFVNLGWTDEQIITHKKGRHVFPQRMIS